MRLLERGETVQLNGHESDEAARPDPELAAAAYEETTHA